MDLVASSSDDESTLLAVLAFVDGSDHSSSGSTDASPSASTTPGASRPAPRVQTAKYTTQLQRKKRAELAALRDQVESLEAIIAQLQRAHARRIEAEDGAIQGEGDGSEPRWRRVALSEHQARHRAETLNKRLRAALRSHRALGSAVLHVLRKRSAGECDLAAILAPDPERNTSLGPRLGLSVEAELQHRMAQLHAESHVVFQPELIPSSGSSRVSSSFEIVRDSSGATEYIEVRTSTPVEQSPQEAARMLWRDASLSGQQPYANKRHTVVAGRDGRTLEKKFVMALAPEQPARAFSSQPVQLSGAHLVQRFDSPSDRHSVIITSAVVLAPSSGLQFREHWWVSVTAAPTPQSGSVIAKCYRVYPAEHRGPINAQPPRSSQDEAAFVLQTLAGNTRLVMQAAQNELLSGELFRQVAAFNQLGH